MMLETSRSDSDKLTLPQPSVFHVKDLAKPNLLTFVNDSNFARIVINFEELHHLDLEVKIVKLASLFLPANFLNFGKGSDILAGKDLMLGEVSGDPVSELLNDFLLCFLKSKTLAIVRERSKFF